MIPPSTAPAPRHAPKSGNLAIEASGESSSRYVAAALARAAERVALAAPGSRNSNLNRETWCLARLVATGALRAQLLADSLARAGLAAGLDASEVVATITSAMRAAGVAQ